MVKINDRLLIDLEEISQKLQVKGAWYELDEEIKVKLETFLVRLVGYGYLWWAVISFCMLHNYIWLCLQLQDIHNVCKAPVHVLFVFELNVCDGLGRLSCARYQPKGADVDEYLNA